MVECIAMQQVHVLPLSSLPSIKTHSFAFSQTGNGLKNKQPIWGDTSRRVRGLRRNWGWLGVKPSPQHGRWSRDASNCCLKRPYVWDCFDPSVPLPYPTPEQPSLLLFQICSLISIPDLSSCHLQWVWSANPSWHHAHRLSLSLSPSPVLCHSLSPPFLFLTLSSHLPHTHYSYLLFWRREKWERSAHFPLFFLFLSP